MIHKNNMREKRKKERNIRKVKEKIIIDFKENVMYINIKEKERKRK